MAETFEAWVRGLIESWWEARPESTRQTLRTAASEDRMDDDTVRLLIDSRCPIGPIGSKWQGDSEYSWSWNQPVKDFILAT